MSGESSNVSVAPVNVLWRIEQQELIDLTGLTASGLGGTSFDLFLPDGTEYYVWFDENNADVDPTPGGTAIEVDYASSAAASAIATACAAAIDAVSGFEAQVKDSTKVQVTRSAVGACTATADNDSGVAITVCRNGKDYDLGLLEGDVTLNTEADILTLTSHQSGVTPRAALFRGFSNLSVDTVMQETVSSQLDDIYNLYGGQFTPAAGTEVFGGGTSKQGNNLLVDAARLVLKPVNAANDADNISLSLAIPQPSSMTFSGENPKVLSVTWLGYVDDSKDSRISAFMFGDDTQIDGLLAT